MADPIRAALEQAANELDIAENALLCSSFHNAASRAKQAAMTARAAIAADRAQRQPVPPEQGEVQELWEVMAEACAQHPDGIVDLKPGAIAAMIRALRDRELPEEWDPPMLGPHEQGVGTRWAERQRLRALLTAEADRAERGETINPSKNVQ